MSTDRPSSVRWLAAAVLAASVLTSCGNSDEGGSDVTTVSGNCALHNDKYSLSPVSTDRLESALGPGKYSLRGGVFSDDGSDRTRGYPVDGDCSYTDSDGVRRLAVSLGNKNLPYSSYADARRTQESDKRAKPIEGADGYVITQDVKDNDGSTAQQAVAVIFDGDRIVTANILVPGKDIDSEKQAVAIAREALTSFTRRMAGAS